MAAWGVLVEPRDQLLREKLLATGPCGYQPPMAFWGAHDSWKPWGTWHETHTGSIRGRRALVIGWECKPVPEGLDRLGRVNNVTRGWAEKVVSYALGWWPDDVEAIADHGFGARLILIDEEGKELTL